MWCAENVLKAHMGNSMQTVLQADQQSRRHSGKGILPAADPQPEYKAGEVGMCTVGTGSHGSSLPSSSFPPGIRSRNINQEYIIKQS